MAEYTKNYNFKKPDKTDYFNINDQNENWDLLDETLKKQKQESQDSINKLQHTITVNLPAANWSSGSPYTQSVRVEGVTEDMVLDGCLYIPKGTTVEQEKALVKAAVCVSYFDTGAGEVAATRLGKKPNADFAIMLKGV